LDERAPRYEQGCFGRLHRKIADSTAVLAMATNPCPVRLLDVSCGTGFRSDAPIINGVTAWA
jgi:hypothetical protein